MRLSSRSMARHDERRDVATSVTLEELDLTVAPSRPPETTAPWVGTCIEDRHPTLQGRVRVRWVTSAGTVSDRWVPTLLGASVREGDRVLLLAVTNEPEPVVMGVLDGFTKRPEAQAQGPVLTLATGESLRVVANDGTALVEVRTTREGPVVRLLTADAMIELPGRLTVTADAIALHARRGAVEVTASDDVSVRGEVVRLNSPTR